MFIRIFFEIYICIYVCRYDLDERNLAVIYCPHGQPNTGILIACLLKYIGAFETTAQAYDFYCSKRCCMCAILHIHEKRSVNTYIHTYMFMYRIRIYEHNLFPNIRYKFHTYIHTYIQYIYIEYVNVCMYVW